MLHLSSISLLPVDQDSSILFWILAIVVTLFTLVVLAFFLVERKFISDKEGYEKEVAASEAKHRALLQSAKVPNYKRGNAEDIRRMNVRHALSDTKYKELALIKAKYEGKRPKRFLVLTTLIGIMGITLAIVAAVLTSNQDNIHNAQVHKSWAVTASSWAAKNYGVISGMGSMTADSVNMGATSGNVIMRNSSGERFEVHANLVIIGRTYVLLDNDGKILPRPVSAPKFKTTTNFYDNPNNSTFFFEGSKAGAWLLGNAFYPTNLGTCSNDGSHCKGDRYATIQFLTKNYGIRDADALRNTKQDSGPLYYIHAITKYGEVVTGQIIKVGNQMVFIDPLTNVEYDPSKPWNNN